MPYKQNQDGADDCGHQSTNEAKNLDIQETGKHPAHKGPGYADPDAVTFSAIHPASTPINSIERKPTSG
jgi:hypothetical protein